MPFDMRKSVALVGGSWDSPAAFPACKGKNELRMSIEVWWNGRPTEGEEERYSKWHFVHHKSYIFVKRQITV
jgi:hypothetical protein